MASTTKPLGTRNASTLRSGVLKRFAQIIIAFTVQAAILFGVSGQLGWIWAWVFLGISILVVFINGIISLRKSLEMIAERGNAKPARTWDKIISKVYSFSLFLAVPLVAGLDVRFGWTQQLNAAWHIAGAVVMTFGLVLVTTAMNENAFFSTAARIQTDRGHTVCSTGPYRFVRHPGYVAFVLQSLSTPVILGSIWALLPGAVAAVTLIVRIVSEDRMLQAELPGYTEYARKVRYRLIPGIW